MSNNKSVFITGASAGFGYDTARALAERGHTVYATMRGTQGKNKEIAEELTQWSEKNGYHLHALELDVTDQTSVDKAVKAAVGHGGVDVLINNAGVGVMGLQEAFTLEQIEGLFAVNVFGVLRVNRAILPHFREKKSGRVVYISSGLGRLVLPFFGPYTATKFAIEALAQTAAFELSPLGIDSIIVQPGAYGTTFLQNLIIASDDKRTGQYGQVVEQMEAFGKNFEERAKAGQMGDPAEVVQALVEAVEADRGKLPERRPVGEDVSGPVKVINQTSDKIHAQLYKAFGLN